MCDFVTVSGNRYEKYLDMRYLSDFVVLRFHTDQVREHEQKEYYNDTCSAYFLFMEQSGGNIVLWLQFCFGNSYSR